MIPNNWYKTLNPKTGSHLPLKLVRLTVIACLNLSRKRLLAMPIMLYFLSVFHCQLFSRQTEYYRVIQRE